MQLGTFSLVGNPARAAKMIRSSASEEDLCVNCLEFIRAISARSKFFEATTLSKDPGKEGLWPPRLNCKLCQMISRCSTSRSSLERNEPNQTEIFYNEKSSVGGDDRGISNLRLASSAELRLEFAIWSENGNKLDLPSNISLEMLTLSSRHSSNVLRPGADF